VIPVLEYTCTISELLRGLILLFWSILSINSMDLSSAVAYWYLVMLASGNRHGLYQLIVVVVIGLVLLAKFCSSTNSGHIIVGHYPFL